MLLATAEAVSWQHLFIFANLYFLHPFVKHLKAPRALNAFQTDHLTYLANHPPYQVDHPTYLANHTPYQVDHHTYIAHRILTFAGYI